MKDFEVIRDYVQELLNKEDEWKKRFEVYADIINNNIDNIKNIKSKFNLRDQLFLYINITESKKNHPKFNLRYLGQNVANLSIESNDVIISTSKYNKTNKDHFNCSIELSNTEWKSNKAKEFRKHYSNKRARNPKLPKKNNEHRIESLLLTEFSKNKRSEKNLINIQPVKLVGIARFQMPTPISASKKPFKYSNHKGGGIDILARVGTGPNTKLCIMEIKDENKHKDDPMKAIEQGLAYAVFIRELLRSASGETWWKLFGFKLSVPKKLKLSVACVMPLNENKYNNDTSFKGKSITIGEDTINIHYLYFGENNNKIFKIETSLNK